MITAHTLIADLVNSMKDKFEREIDYIRISITDRCNLRCRYCMPEEGIPKVSMDEILKYEEILRVCRAAAELGISKYKITGGEPLVRKGCVNFCKMLKEIPGVQQVTLTTNGQLLEDYLPELAEAGIDGINISIDSMDEERYGFITRCGNLKKTLKGLDGAIALGIKTKINCLMHKGFNEDELLNFARLAFDKNICVRFIEIMPVGFGEPDTGISNETVLKKLKGYWPDLIADDTIHGNGPAVYYHRPGHQGSIGLISAIHGKFCGSCNRIRLTSKGKIKPCLCYEKSFDLKPALAEGQSAPAEQNPATPGGNGAQFQSDAALKKVLAEAIESKPSGHTFEDRDTVERKSMVEIGG